MVRHHRRLREPGWRRSMAVNALGSVATGVVTVIVAVTKFTSGAWIPVIVVPVVVGIFLAIRRFYGHLERALTVSPELARPAPAHLTAVVMVGQLHRGILSALNFARGMCPERVVALHVCTEDDDGEGLRRQWEELGIDVPLEMATAHFRDLGGTVEGYVEELRRRWPGTDITLVTSQYAAGGIFDDLLHNQSLVLLREQLMVNCEVAVVAVPYRIR
jgi:hypothetical protein